MHSATTVWWHLKTTLHSIFMLLFFLLALSLAQAKVCRVTDFGAVGDNATEDTTALQAALDSCTPGTTIFDAPGKYLSRKLKLNWEIKH